MKSAIVEFAGLRLQLPKGWNDVTDDLPGESPPTLAKTNGVGALQFSVAKYERGPRPSIDVEVLQDMLREFAEAHELGMPASDVRISHEIPLSVSADFADRGEFIRLWYLTNGTDVVLATYVSERSRGPRFHAELVESEQIVKSIQIL